MVIATVCIVMVVTVLHHLRFGAGLPAQGCEADGICHPEMLQTTIITSRNGIFQMGSQCALSRRGRRAP